LLASAGKGSKVLTGKGFVSIAVGLGIAALSFIVEG
jgi:hypothetical protein